MVHKLPIGVQSFTGLRNYNFLYIDKTEYIYKLVRSGKQFFLIRPRRFGKSLFISTLKAYWEGKQEFFKDLAISGLEADRENAWKEYPMFCFDFNGQNYRNENGLEDILDEQLRRWEKEYDVAAVGSLGERFRNLLITASQKKGLGCVVLVDEYDKPFLDVADDIAIQEHNKEVFRAFFSTLKSFDDYIRFVFITGVTKFHKVSIFSDLNQLNDISLNVDYSGICGITDEELRKLADKAGIPHKSLNHQMLVSTILFAIRRNTYLLTEMIYYVTSRIASMLLGRWIGMMGMSAVGRYLGMAAGPIGWTLLAGWTLSDIASPAYRVMIPAVIMTASMRFRQTAVLTQKI